MNISIGNFQVTKEGLQGGIKNNHWELWIEPTTYNRERGDKFFQCERDKGEIEIILWRFHIFLSRP